MWAIQVILLMYVLQIQIHSSIAKPQAPIGTDDAVCGFYNQGNCNVQDIKKLCPNLCKPEIACGFDERIRDVSENIKDSSLWRNIGGVAALYKSATHIGPKSHICGAVVISNEFLLTAAHCVLDRQASTLSITVGREDLNDESVGNQYEIQNIILHPEYRSTVNGRNIINDYSDIALLKTSRILQFSNKIWPFLLPEKNQELNDFQGAMIAGWGQVNASKRSKASIVQRSQVQIVDNSRCECIWLQHAAGTYTITKRDSYPQGLTKQIICAGGNGADSCPGDSGGPLAYRNTEGVNIVMGIIGKGTKCPPFPLLPSFYINVATYVDWIQRTIAGHLSTISQPITISQPAYTNLDLWNAAKDGNLAEVKSMLAAGVDPNWQNPKHNLYTSLHIASENNHPSIMRNLLDNRAIKNQKDIQGFTSVFHASNHGHIDSLSTLIEYGANVDLGTNDNYTALMQSTGKGFLDIVEALTNAKADVKLINSRGMTALHEAGIFNRIEIARLLFWKGADIRKQGNKGETPIDKARLHGYYELENILKELAGINVIKMSRPEISKRIVIQINKGRDLWNAARDGNLASVRNAIANGNNPNWKNHNHNRHTPLHIAALNNHPLIISVLIAAGADKDMKDISGFTPIFIAASRGSKDAVQTLIRHRANVETGSSTGYTPLMQATGKGYLAIVNALIEGNAIVDKLDNKGDTAFAVAAHYNRQKIAKLLLRKGANPQITGDSGKTPEDRARERGFSDLADYIDGLPSITG